MILEIKAHWQNYKNILNHQYWLYGYNYGIIGTYVVANNDILNYNYLVVTI